MNSPLNYVLPFFLLSAAASAEPVAATATPAERHIARAELALERLPESASSLADLAMAYARRARETADTAHYEKAHGILDHALALDPENFAARRVRAWAWLGQHEFVQALELARELNEQAPDDVLVYGLLSDALVELGRYDEAADAVQWMLDLRPGNVPAMTRAAHLRELHGYQEGALDFLRKAFDRTSPLELEDRAWILVQIAHLERQQGSLQRAEETVAAALELFPEYHYALAELGRILHDRGQAMEAAEVLQRRYQAAPHPENLYELARALEQAGKAAEAREAYAEFARDAEQESESWDNSNRELIDYYLEVSPDTKRALEVAELEIARRQDVYTRAAYGWALYRAGRIEEARRQFSAVREMNLPDPEIRRRAEIVLSES